MFGKLLTNQKIAHKIVKPYVYKALREGLKTHDNGKIQNLRGFGSLPLRGELSFSKATGEAGNLYDLTDEVNAYNKQELVNHGMRWITGEEKVTKKSVLSKFPYYDAIDTMNLNSRNRRGKKSLTNDDYYKK